MCTNTSLSAGNPEFLRQAGSGRQAGLGSTGWGPGSGGRRAGLLQLRGGGQRERTQLAPSSKRTAESSEPS